MIDGVSMITPKARCKSCIHGRSIDWDSLCEYMRDAGFTDNEISDYQTMYGLISGAVWCGFRLERRPVNDYCPEWQEGETDAWPASTDEFETQFPALRRKP